MRLFSRVNVHELTLLRITFFRHAGIIDNVNVLKERIYKFCSLGKRENAARLHGKNGSI